MFWPFWPSPGQDPVLHELVHFRSRWAHLPQFRAGPNPGPTRSWTLPCAPHDLITFFPTLFLPSPSFLVLLPLLFRFISPFPLFIYFIPSNSTAIPLPTMSHPAASIKSIISGKTNLDTPDNLEPFQYSNDSTSFDADSSYDPDDDSVSRFSEDSGYSVSSRNLKNLSAPVPPSRSQLYQQSSSTNVSIASSGSDYQLGLVGGGPVVDPVPQDAYSRPTSRNSTTSCLSTTATKDGVEGRRLHRHGPSPYSSHLISNMIQSQARTDPRPDPRPEPPSNLSQVSVLTTGAQVNGESGAKRAIAIEQYPDLQPPVSLTEKISLLRSEPGEKRL